jgi:hypothetical protein
MINTGDRRYTDRQYRCLKLRMARNFDQYTKRFIKKFGQRVRSIRNDRGWTLEECEEKGYPNWRHLQEIEAGKNFNLTTLLRLAELFGMEPSELLKGILKER